MIASIRLDCFADGTIRLVTSDGDGCAASVTLPADAARQELRIWMKTRSLTAAVRQTADREEA